MFYSLLYLRAWQGGWYVGGTREISGEKKEKKEGSVREMARGEGGEKEEQSRIKKNKASLPRNSSPGKYNIAQTPYRAHFLYYKEGFHTTACPLRKHSPPEPTGLERFVSSPCKLSGMRLPELCLWHLQALSSYHFWLIQKEQDMPPFANLVSLRLWEGRR